MKPSILIVDDEPGVRSAAERRAARRGLRGRVGAERRGCLERVTRGGRRPHPARRVAARHGRPGDAGAAARAAGRRRSRPDLRARQHRVGRARDQARGVRLRREAALAREDRARRAQRAAPAPARGREPRAARARRSPHTMVGESYAMRQLREQVAMAAPTNGRVLIYGENGTGKELVARHDPRAEPPPARGLRRGQLRRHSRGAHRERAVRPRARRLHRRGGRPARQVRGGRRRHDLPRRDRRHEPEDAGQGAARPAGADDGAGGRDRRASRSTCAWWRPPTRICRARSAPAGSARTSTSGST